MLAHERAHLRERHDLVVLPFVAWGATAPFVQGMVRAQIAVAALVEMRADDVAGAHTRPAELAVRAAHASGAPPPRRRSGSFVTALDRRLDRITAPPAPLPGPVSALVRLAAAALVALPPLALLFS